MIVRTFLAALLAGILAGVLVTPLQYAKVVPLILQAETYENGGGEAPHDHHAAASVLVTSVQAQTAAVAPAEEEGTTLVESRLGGTVLANIVIGAGFALLLTGASLLVGVQVTATNGAFWGLAGFAIVALAPALGLPPELPAMPAADLEARQLWWLLTVGLAAVGVYALVLVRAPWAKALGVLALLLPHLVGAPHPAELASPVPPTLAAEFAVASLATSAALWLLVAVLAGFAFDRARRAEGRPTA